jgi:hypothetical protein
VSAALRRALHYHYARYHFLSPSRCCSGKERTRLVRGPRDFSRGIRTQFSRTEGSGCSRQRVAVSSSGCLWCPEIFQEPFDFSFRSVFRLKRSRPTGSFGALSLTSGCFRPSWTGCRCRGLPRRPPQEASVKGACIWPTSSNSASSFDPFRSIFECYPQLVDKRPRAARAIRPARLAAFGGISGCSSYRGRSARAARSARRRRR